MNFSKLLYATWLLPLALFLLTGHQVWTFYNIIQTYTNGDSYTANVEEFDIKQIAAQTNGYVILNFETSNGRTVTRKLSLPVQLAAQFMESDVIPIRYNADSSVPVVMIKTYDTHKRVALINASIAFLFALACFGVALIAHKKANKSLDKKSEFTIERTDV